MKNFVLILFLSLSIQSFAQTPVRFQVPKSELFFRAKVLGMVIIEDLFVRSLSVGGEYRFGYQFAVSADYVHYQLRSEVEDYDDPNNSDAYTEYSQRDRRNYWAFQAKWYPKIAFDINGIQPYFSVLAKVGGRKLYDEENYPHSEGNLIGISGSFYDLGLTAGILTSGPIGADISFGWAKRTETRYEERYHLDSPSTFEKINEQKFGPVLRVNFYVMLVGWNNYRMYKGN